MAFELPNQSAPPKHYDLVASFPDSNVAARAVERLLAAGVPRDRVFIVAPADSQVDVPEDLRRAPAGERAPVAVIAGSSIGGAIAALGGAVLGVATGGGIFLLGGAVLGASAGGVFGGLLGAMAGRGMEDEARDYYDQAVRGGAVLVGAELEGSTHASAARAALEASGGTVIKLKEQSL